MINNLRMNYERYLRFTWEEIRYLDQSQKQHREILNFVSPAMPSERAYLLKRHILGTGTLVPPTGLIRDDTDR